MPKVAGMFNVTLSVGIAIDQNVLEMLEPINSLPAISFEMHDAATFIEFPVSVSPSQLQRS